MPWTPEYESVLRQHLPLAGADPIPPAAELRDLGLDSLELVSLLLDLEESFGVTVPDELLVGPTFATAGSLWTAMSSLTAPEGQLEQPSEIDAR
jgi:acyl carrier protein